MLGITQDQIAMAIRWVLTALSGVLSGFLISKGWATTASASGFTIFIIGLVPSITSFIWGLWIHSTKGTIAAASALPEVHSVVTTPEIAHSTQFGPDDKVVTFAESRSPPKDKGIG